MSVGPHWHPDTQPAWLLQFYVHWFPAAFPLTAQRWPG